MNGFNMDLPIYCLTFRSEENRKKMTNRFNTCGLGFEFVESTDAYDPEICPPETMLNIAKSINRWEPRAWSCMHGHLKILKKISEQEEDLAIICEDDVYLRRDIKKELPNIIVNFYRLNLDILLLGYLTEKRPFIAEHDRPSLLPIFGYFGYDNEPYFWGTQMYMIRKSHAKELYEKFGPRSPASFYSLLDSKATPFASDWILTKQGRRAFISPQIAVSRKEQGTDPTNWLHNANYYNNYHPELYI
jgi:GR25 family glycosyltransferase involved in LPS biosynthesis